MLELKNVTYSYPGGIVPSLVDVSLRVAPGELVCLVGPNGSGKSTAGQMACASLIPDTGEVVVDDVPLAATQGGELVGMVGQDPREWLVCPLVGDEVRLGPRCHGLEPDEIENRAHRALDACGIRALENSRIAELSGGQQQLVALAGMLALHPRYLVLDEPFAHLDIESRKRVEAVIDRVRAAGVGVLLITHNLCLVEHAQRVVVIHGGKAVWEGTPETWHEHPEVQAMAAGTDVDEPKLPIRAARTDTKPLIMHDASYEIDGRRIVDRLSLESRPGELVLLCGPSGSGKTTTAHMLAGVARPVEGEVLLGGKPVKPGQVGLAFQRCEDQLFASTVFDDVAYGPRNLDLSEVEVERRVTEALQGLNLPRELWNRHSLTLSGGMRHRVALASIVAQQPEAYVLDEPTAGLDGSACHLVREWVAQVRTSSEPVVLVTHDPEDWEGVASHAVRLQPRDVSKTGGATDGVATVPMAPEGRQRPSACLDVRTWLLIGLVMIVGLFACHRPQGLLLASVACTALLVRQHEGVERALQMLKPSLPLLVLVLLANSMRVDGTGTLVLWGAIGVSRIGLLKGIVAAWRIALLVVLVAVLRDPLATIDGTQIASLVLASPANRGRTVADAAQIISTTLTLIPQIFDDFSRLEVTQRARGARLDKGSPIDRLKAWSAVMVPLVVLLFERADSLACALRLRGYRGTMTLPSQRLTLRDLAAFIAAIALAFAIAWV